MYQLPSPFTTGRAASRESAQQHGGALAAPSARRRHRWCRVAELAALVLAAAAVIISTQPRPAAGALTAGRIAAVNDPGTQGVGSVAFSPDGKMLAAADQNGRTYLRHTATGRLVATLTDPAGNGIGVGASAAFSPNGTTLATSDGNQSTFLWDVGTGRRIATLTDPGSHGVTSVAFSPDGTILAAADDNGRIYLWDVAAGRQISSVTDPAHGAGVTTVAFSPNGTTLAAGDGYGDVYLWDIAAARLIATLTDPDAGYGLSVTSVTFSPDGTNVAAGDTGGDAYVWHAGAREPDVAVANPGSMALNYSSEEDDDSPGSGNDAVYVAFGPDGTLVAADYFGGDICWWRGASRLATVADGSQWISALALSPDGRTLAVGGGYQGDHSLVLWKVS
jgi:WD40 repeat protein